MPTLNKPALKLISTLSKGGKGSTTEDALRDALEALEPGWNVERGMAALKITGTNSYDIKNWHQRNRVRDLNFSDSLHKTWVADLPLNSSTRIQDYIHRVSGTPTNPKRGELYATQITKTEYLDLRGAQWFELGKIIWIGAESLTVTAPSKAKFEVIEKFEAYSGNKDYWTDIKSPGLMKFLYTNGLQSKAQDYLESEGKNVDKVLRPSQIRDLSNTGTCSVCFRNVKMRGGAMVDHGYTVPKFWGGRSGNCPGVGWNPWEISPEGTKNYLKILQSLYDQNEDRLDTIQKNPSIVLKGPKGEEIAPTDPKYARKRATIIQNMQATQRMIQHDIDTYTDTIREWKPGTLPGE